MKKLFTIVVVFYVNILYAEFQHKEFTMSTPTIEHDHDHNHCHEHNHSGMIAMFFLPSSNNFSANVNVQKQLFKEDIGKYRELTLQQMKIMKFTILKDTVNKNIFTLEYTGKQQNRNFHWYVKACQKGNFIYLITGATLAENWSTQGDELKKSVDSFALK